MKLSKIYSENRLLILLVSILIILIGLPVIILLLINKNMTTAAAWYDTDWLHRKTVSVSNDTGSTLTDEDVLVTVDTETLITEGKLQSSCNDLRFVDSDDSTVLDYWIEGGCGGTTTQVWVRIPSLPAGGKTIYMYYDNSVVANGEQSWSGSFISISDQSSCGSGWTQFSALDGRFPMGSDTYGTTGGSTTHSHTATASANSKSASVAVYPLSYGNSVSYTTHDHNPSVNLTSSVNNMPQYTNVLYCSNTKLENLSNNIALFNTSTVTGWTQYSALDDRFPLGATSSIGTTGGSTYHTHTVSFGLSNAGGSKICQNCTASCHTAVVANHNHTAGTATTTEIDNNTPEYLAMVYMKMSSADTLTTERPIYILNTSTIPLGWERFTALDAKFPIGATTYGATGGSNTHSHSGSKVTGTTSATKDCTWYDSGNFNAMAGHNHTISWSTDGSVSNLPPYLTVVFAQRKDSQTTVLGAEDSPAPLAPTVQTATAESISDIIWNFTDNSTDEDGFKVYDISGTLKVTCALPNISSCLESSLSENTEYTRKFTAYNSMGESEFSDTTSAYTKASSIDITDIQSTVDTVSLTASTFVNDTLGLSGYYFDCTSESCDTGINEWLQTNTDEATGLDNNSTYKFTVKNRNGDGIENDYPIFAQEIWTKAAVPTISEGDITNTTIVLNGTGVNNLTQGSSGLYFDCITGSSCDNGINEWVSGDTDTVTGLSSDTEYEFKVKARNYDAVETEYSSNSVIVYTDSSQASISSVSNATTNSLKVIVNNAGNPSTTLYLVEEVNTAKYIESTGQLVIDPQWLTYSQLGEASGITVTGLDSNTEYTFRVKAKNQIDVETDFSSPESAYTRLLTPTALTPESKTDSSIVWKISSTETGYTGIRIYDSTDKEVKTCSGDDITECEETGLDPNTEYGRKFSIYNTHGESDMTSLISATTYAQSVSISIASAVNYYEVSLTIDLGNNPVGTDLQIFEETTSKYYDDTLGILLDGEQTFSSTGNSITVSGLSPNIEYSFKVRALNSDGDSTVWSSSSTVRTYAQVPNIISATGLSTTSGRLVIDLQDNPIGTRVSILEDGGRYVSESGELVETEDVFILSGDSIDITGLSPNTIYTFKVRAYNEDDVATEWSSTLNLITHIEQPTTEITDQTKNSMTLTISGVSNIEQGTSGVYVEDIGTWSKELTQTVTGLDPNTSYSFNVKARNGEGIETSYVESESGYTLAEIPTVSDTSATSTTSGEILISLGNNPGGTRISILEENGNKYLASNGILTTEETILDTTELEFSVTGLQANTTYSFKVKAYNEEDYATEWSSAVDLTTLIQSPTVSVSNITNSSVQITASGVSNIPNGDSGLLVERIGSWSKNLTQTVSSLSPNTQYTFRVKARNADGIATSYVSTSSIYTLASIPVISSVTKLSSNTARVYLNANGNPSTTQFAIRDEISGQYVSANGNLQDNPVWQTYTQWGGASGKYISGIEDVRQLGFQAKARNSENIETSFSDAEYIGTGSVILNAPTTISINLKDDVDVDLSSDPQLGIQDVRIEKDQYLVADLKVSFEENRDWEDVVADADTDNSKTVIKVENKHGVTDPFTMYVVRNDTNAFRLCPEATSLDEVKSGCAGEQLLTKDFPQEIEIEGNIVTISEAKINGVYYWIADGLTGTGGMGETVAEDVTPIDDEEYDNTEDQVDENIEDNTVVNRVTTVINNVAQNIVLGTTEIFDKTAIAQLSEEELTTAVATTTTVTITVGIATTGFMQSFYLIFHFFNSLFNAIGFKGKKKPFGYVYDSVTKEPISNAVVRIYSGKRLIDTTVTNADGMFLANLKEGKYTIKVKKGGYNFPSSLIKGTEDYPLKNIYKGEILNNKEESDLIVSIPLDKLELSTQNKFFTSLKSLLSGVLTVGNILLFVFGILLIIYTYYQHQDTFNWYVILLYIPALYFLTKSIFGNTTVYGKVFDENRKPVVGVELYLVDKEFNEVTAKRITDKKGRYRFVCKKGTYDLKMGKDILLSDIKIKKDGYILSKKIILN
ncbi:MAG: DUF2341 domain-containing protein [Candidatus Dojkabacteria bacterium]|nr:DUF2341 domain-containing protein [Candidatus Dojkabacteria bacterium]